MCALNFHGKWTRFLSGRKARRRTGAAQPGPRGNGEHQPLVGAEQRREGAEQRHDGAEQRHDGAEQRQEEEEPPRGRTRRRQDEVEQPQAGPSTQPPARNTSESVDNGSSGSDRTIRPADATVPTVRPSCRSNYNSKTLTTSTAPEPRQRPTRTLVVHHQTARTPSPLQVSAWKPQSPHSPPNG
ncbi:hypothetical protein BDV95DRAFT_101264 [Massariosphaeria phaeospora]|uniref:Uncharacterized protein n=1 Tax=Massariosphaeria phaeospora TaxID=100035 RepID=A0A7C8IC46_9PLEO|nr:hypothetical protein BDV95DRAFT_101264 [Massariosphaeria phaeospora]